MVHRWLLIILIAAQVTLPFGGGLCASEATPVAVVEDCCGGCDIAAACECCCYEAEQQPADQASATLANVEPTVPHLIMLVDALPEPTAVPHAALCFQRTVTPRDFLICLTRAQRAPPA